MSSGDAPNQVLLLDFVRGMTRWITNDEVERLMREQYDRGVRMTIGPTPPPPEKNP